MIYDRVVDGVPIIQSVTCWFTPSSTGVKELWYRIERSDVELQPASSERFALADFGIPDPDATAVQKGWILLVILGGAGLVIAALVRHQSRGVHSA